MQQQQQQQQQDKQRVVSSSGLHVALATAQTFSISAAASAVGATAVYPSMYQSIVRSVVDVLTHRWR